MKNNNTMITEFHKENMKKHIKFLEDNADRIRASFDMTQLEAPTHIGCGTAACSLGWATVSVGWKFMTDEFPLFGISGIEKGIHCIWQYCFSSIWKEINNTPEAAAARMKAVLHNQVPNRWDFTSEFAHPIVIEEEVPESKTFKAVL